MSALIEFRAFENRPEATAAAADLLVSLVNDVLDQSPHAEASLVVSGGSTPGPCFDLMSATPLDWSRVTVVPSDERWVSPDSRDSNERLIRQRLLTGLAAKGKVLPFFRSGLDASQAPRLIEKDLAGLTQPFSAVLLGMGEDGHFASLFPDFDGLQKALDPHDKSACTMVQTSGSPHLRISLTLSALLNCTHTVLLIFGEAKREVFEAASADGSAYPIGALLHEIHKPLTVIWAP
ncbi:MAG: 6-phosphogluconolactonase [Lysobacterales bacterium]|jgi:6-phosphogluconolactonase